MAYLRSQGQERILVVIQPKKKASRWTSKNLGIDILEPLLESRLQSSLVQGKASIQSQGPGYGVYRLI